MHISKTYIALLTFCCSFSAVADESKEPHSVGIGLNYSVIYQEYKGDRTNTAVLPTLFYDNKQFYVEGDEAGMYLMHDDQNALRINLYYDDKEYRPSGSLHQLDKRKWSVMAGASYMRITPVGGFKIQFGHDVLGRTKGSVVKLAHLTEFKYGQWDIYPEFGVQWNDTKYNRYYYGISAVESARSGLSAYIPKHSISPYAGLNLNYTINPSWSVFMGMNVHYLSDQQHNSPMVKHRVNVEPSIGLLYWY